MQVSFLFKKNKRLLTNKDRLLKRFTDNIIFCFPIHLLIYHVKKNQLLLGFWLLLVLIIKGDIGGGLGVPYLFLDPEYLDKVDFWSFFVVGFSLGGFTMAFNITTYILDGYRYNFLAALPRPFMKFCVNNSIIPLSFLVYFLIRIISFQIEYENESLFFATIKVSGFLLGYIIMIISTFAYFKATNKDIFKIFSESLDKTLKRNRLQRVNVMDRILAAKKKKVIITSYITPGLKLKKVNNNYPYDKVMLLKVFDQNQLNAVTIQLLGFITIIFLGIFRDISLFQIPAAASCFLLLSITLLLSGAISYWLRDWAVSITLVSILLISFFLKDELNSPTHQAFGLRYDKKASYTVSRLKNLNSLNNYNSDKRETISVLDKWKSKFEDEVNETSYSSNDNKPPLIIICSSGGGLRSAVWTMRSLQYLDSLLSGKLIKHTVLMTGSSGGVIGAAYFRELQLQKLAGNINNIYDLKYVNQMAKDKLNSVIFSLVVSDLFFKFQKIKIAGQNYYKDRGYALEQGLLEHTDFLFDKSISDYYDVERNAMVPMLMMSPTIVNDGRKLIISPLNVSYLTGSRTSNNNRHKVKAIEFRRFFKEQNADSLRFVTALRMNATFPYITPNVVLPSEPLMETIDAGLSDNFGVSLALNFLHVFKDWINENTSKVIVISIRDSIKEPKIRPNNQKSFIKDAFTPIDNLLSNISNFQDINNDNKMEFTYEMLDHKLYKVDFQYSDRFTSNFRASLNWRLTTKEKKSIIAGTESNFNQKSVRRLQQLLKD